jgi:hypothetical protein
MSHDLFVHQEAGSLSKALVLHKISALYNRTRDALPITVLMPMRVSARNWEVLDPEWPGNDKEWFGYRTKVTKDPDVLNVAYFDVELFYDNGN